jgi:hypothetical protein
MEFECNPYPFQKNYWILHVGKSRFEVAILLVEFDNEISLPYSFPISSSALNLVGSFAIRKDHLG